MTQTITNAYENIQGIGRVWAAYGANLGKSALDGGAKQLRATATYLDTLAARMDEIKGQISPPLAEEVEEQAAAKEQAPEA